MHTTPARVFQRAMPEGLDLGDMMGVEPFIFSAEISSNRLDAFYGRMGESTLRNFAADAQAGISFQDSHSSTRLGFGHSFAGIFEVEGDISRVVADFYTIPGIEFGGMQSYRSTDDFIKAIKSRLARDVSVGFYGGTELCDICGEPVWEWWEGKCPHIPGVEYAVGNRGEDTVIATFTVENARLSEVSAVYDGATPEAMILKTQRQIEEGKLSPASVRMLETRYRIKLPEPQKLWTGLKTKGNIMEEQSILTDIRAILSEAKAPQDDEVQGVRWLVEEVTHLTAELRRLETLADDGKKYRVDLITETLTEGVRAMGDTFPEEVYRGMLESVSLEAIKKMRDSFKAQADARYPGGRQTVDEDEQKPKQTGLKDFPTPAAAYN